LVPQNKKIKAYRTILVILSVVLFKRETWSLTLREKHRPRGFENRLLKRIFRPKRNEITREWRKLHNEELSYLYASSNIIRVIKSRSAR
jgi:hypothetical protein